tara:strand:+ start:224 stop:568 length:345 start_codon:yes stop_codon:yes gene_type:complete
MYSIDRRVRLKAKLNEKELYQLFHSHHYVGVFHLATISPYTIDSQNIITGTLNLLSQVCTANVNNIVFASSGLVYGSPTRAELGVTVPTAPETPFATTTSPSKACWQTLMKPTA